MERNGYGGFTIAYSAGPKKGLRVHFFARRELESGLRRAGLDLLGAPVERTERRLPPETGEWGQWGTDGSEAGAASRGSTRENQSLLVLFGHARVGMAHLIAKRLLPA